MIKNISPILKTVAPILDAALKGDFRTIAANFIEKNVSKEDKNKHINEYLNSTEGLHFVRELDKNFSKELELLGIDSQFLLAQVIVKKEQKPQRSDTMNPLKNIQFIISVLFILFYFGMLGAMFFVEVSDTYNMKQGGNSLLDELQILFGVMTAGVGQILSYWFGGLLGKPK